MQEPNNVTQSSDVAPKRLLSIGAGAVVLHEERVLLVRTIYGVTKGRYLLPAGRVNQGEMPDDAAVRETYEETNLRVQVEGLLGVRLWVLDSGEHNYFFMFRAKLLSPLGDLRHNPTELDDARFFSRAEMDALTIDETWAGAIAVAYKELNPQATLWRNHPELRDDSVKSTDGWRIWL